MDQESESDLRFSVHDHSKRLWSNFAKFTYSPFKVRNTWIQRMFNICRLFGRVELNLTLKTNLKDCFAIHPFLFAWFSPESVVNFRLDEGEKRVVKTRDWLQSWIVDIFHTHTHIYVHTNTHAYIYSQTHTYSPSTYKQTDTFIHYYTNTQWHKDKAQAHTYLHLHSHTHTYVHMHTLKYSEHKTHKRTLNTCIHTHTT